MAVTADQQEERTRVVCHLPLNNAAEEKAVKRIILNLEGQRRKRIGLEGYTYSNPGAFQGRWWSAHERDWVGDRIVLLLVDFMIPLTDQRFSLAEQVSELKRTIHDAYAAYGRPQEEVWVVAYAVVRHA